MSADVSERCGLGAPVDRELAHQIAFAAVNTALGSLGRICLALDEEFRVRHASERIEALLGAGGAARLLGQPIEAVLGPELFGPQGPLREALLAGEKREGWRAFLRCEGGRDRLLSVTAAKLRHDSRGVCDPSAAYIVVLRPAEEETADGGEPLAAFGLVCRSPPMTRVLRLVANLQHSESSVLITGESGTGKEVLARIIHAHSPRRNGPFVAVNVAALPHELLESELFGHVRGAFTGAVRGRAGRFETATLGTLFLDEVGDLPLHLQVKLLRVLQERRYERVGDDQTRETGARILAATHRDLARGVMEGTFREDLYYRLRVFPIELPPLRERREDVEPIARVLLSRLGARTGRAVHFSPEVLGALLAYRWPGNVRELENALEYAATVCSGQTLQPEDLPPEVLANAPLVCTPAGVPAGELPAAPLPHTDERARLESALGAHRWNRAEAARALGVSRSTMWRRMRALGLSRGRAGAPR